MMTTYSVLHMNTCECCGNNNGKWYVIDDNYETELCGKCAKDLRKIGEDVKRMEV